MFIAFSRAPALTFPLFIYPVENLLKTAPADIEVAEVSVEGEFAEEAAEPQSRFALSDEQILMVAEYRVYAAIGLAALVLLFSIFGFGFRVGAFESFYNSLQFLDI